MQAVATWRSAERFGDFPFPVGPKDEWKHAGEVATIYAYEPIVEDDGIHVYFQVINDIAGSTYPYSRIVQKDALKGDGYRETLRSCAEEYRARVLPAYKRLKYIKEYMVECKKKGERVAVKYHILDPAYFESFWPEESPDEIYKMTAFLLRPWRRLYC